MVGFWLSLAVLLIALGAGIGYVVVRGLQLWRLAKRTGALFVAESERISGVAAQMERHLADASTASTRLREASALLAESRTRLDVQLAAIREARTQVRRMLWFVPGL